MMSLFERDKVNVKIFRKERVSGTDGNSDNYNYVLERESFPVLIQGKRTNKSKPILTNKSKPILLRSTMYSKEPIGEEINKYIIVVGQYKKAFRIVDFENNTLTKSSLQHMVYVIEETIDDTNELKSRNKL